MRTALISALLACAMCACAPIQPNASQITSVEVRPDAMQMHASKEESEANSYRSLPGYPWNCGTNPRCIIEHGQGATEYKAYLAAHPEYAKRQEQQEAQRRLANDGVKVDTAACAKDPTCRQNDVYNTYQWNGSRWIATGVKFGYQPDAQPTN